MARKHHPEIKIVWARWLNDSLALWERQDEGPYLLEPEPSGGASGSGALASPPSDSQQISSDPDPDADDWDGHLDIGRRGRALGALGVEGPRGGGEDGEELELDEVDWDAINNEVDAAMNESDDDGDDEEGEGDGVSVKSGMSEDDASWTDESNSIIRWVPPPFTFHAPYTRMMIMTMISCVCSSTTSSPRRKRKRVRSLTPSEIGSLNGSDSDVLRSPLAKRKKLAADRASRLKEAFTAEQMRAAKSQKGRDDDEGSNRSQRSSPINGGGDDDDEDEDEDGGSEYNMVEDDFLARELEAEWG